jgi:hypothetical protein
MNDRLPKRYQFDAPQPAVYQPIPLPDQQQTPQVVHIHQAPPDRTLQRVALGAGMGGGAVVAGVYCGPLLVAVLTAIAANLAFVVLLLAVTAWGVVQIVHAVGGKSGEQAAKNVTRTRRALRRR